MILTVTLNPMLDKTVDVASFARGLIHRATHVGMVVGGKGVNVARQLHRLGVETLATGCWGGPVGRMLEELLSAEKIPHDFVKIAGATREGITYREPDGTWTAVFEPPHAVTREEATSIVETCAGYVKRCHWAVCCGSSPCPETDDVYARLIGEAKRAGRSVALDSYGRAFRLALEAEPTLVKVNADEYAQTFGNRPATDEEFRAALRRLVERGVRYAIITDGPRPCFASDGSAWWKVVPSPVRSVNPTGSGDSMIAAVLASLQAGDDLSRALVRGAAAGAANARVWAVSDATDDEIRAEEAGISLSQCGPLQ